MNVIAIGNQKGGTSKTTSAAALGVVLSRAGQRVHLIDMDPQASLTTAFGLRDDDGFLYEALSHQKSLPVVQLGEWLSISPGSIDLTRGETEFMGLVGREFILKSSLERTSLPESTLVIIDCPPSLGVLAVNCLTAATRVLVVVQPGGLELRALKYLQDTITELKKRINPPLEIMGAILTNVNTRRRMTETIATEVRRVYPILGMVRMDAAVVEATAAGEFLELRNSRALEDYEGIGLKLKEML